MSGRAIQHFAGDHHGRRSCQYRIALKLNRHRDGNGPELYADCMRDVTKVIAETTADRERQQLSAITTAARMTSGLSYAHPPNPKPCRCPQRCAIR